MLEHPSCEAAAMYPAEPPGRIGPMRNAAWLLAGDSLPIWSCSVWGLPCLRRYRRSGALLPHHFTLTTALEFRKASVPGKPGQPGYCVSREALRRIRRGRGSRGGIFSVALAVHGP